MNEKREIYRKHIPPSQEAIELAVGEIVKVGREDKENPGWKNWLWCTSKSTGLSGWVPKQYLNICGDTGKAIKAYSAIELQVEPGEVVEIGYHLNGWAWCKNEPGFQGWVPEENFRT